MVFRIAAFTHGGDHVADDGGGCGIFARSAAVKQRFPYNVSVDGNGVEYAVHGGQDMPVMDKTGLDAQFQGVFLPFMVADDDEELDGIPQLPGELEIPAGDVLNAADVNLVRGNSGSVRQHRQDEGLVGGVPAVDVQGGIFFRKAQLLGLDQGVRVIGPVFPHGGEDVIGRSVDDADNGIDMVADQGILQALDDGDAASGGSFKINGRAHFRGKLENLRAVLRQKSLVPVTTGFPARRASVTSS